MRIAGTELNLKHKALEIYLSGCKSHSCVGCHNPELWDFAVGDNVDIDYLESKLAAIQSARLVNSVWILGGEPLDQDMDELCVLLRAMKNHTHKIVLWTHYEDVPKPVAKLVQYAKLGPYVSGGEPYVEPLLGIQLANKEQRIVRLYT